MRVLVAGGTGTVGSEVVTGLIASGLEPRVLTRSKEKIAALRPGAIGFVGDFSDPEALPDALDGVERMFLLNAPSPTETQESLAAVEAAIFSFERVGTISTRMECGNACSRSRRNGYGGE